MRAVVLLTVTGFLSQGVGFLYRILITRLAGAEIMGLYQLILPVYSVLLSLTAAGLNTAVSNLSARLTALREGSMLSPLRGQSVRLFLTLAAVPCTLLLCFSDAASVLLLGDARTRLGLMLLVPCLLLTGVENLQKHVFYGTGRVTPAAVTELLEQILRAFLILSLYVCIRPTSPEKALGVIVLGMAVCEVFAALTQTVLFRLFFGSGGRRKTVSRRSLTRQLGQIAVPLGLTALLGNLLSSANAVLIPRLLVRGGMLQSEAVSAYGVLFGMTFPMLLLPTAFLSALGLVLTPKLSRCLALGRTNESRTLVRRAVRAANLILIPALLLLAVLGGTVGSALYKEPTVGNDLPLLAAGVLFSCWQGLLSSVLCGLDKQGTAAGIALFCDALQLFLTCLTVARWGLTGYGAAFTLSSILGAVWCWKVAAKEVSLKLPVFSWLAAPILAASLAASCGKLMETALLRNGLSPLVSATGAAGFAVLLYLAALQAMGVSWKEEKNTTPT